jgi:hypothetical protein
VTRRLGAVEVPALSAGQALLVRDTGPLTVLTGIRPC